MKLIFNAEALRPPITGIGNYSLNLLKQFLENSGVEEVYCFTGTHWISGLEQYTLALAHDTQGVGLAGASQRRAVPTVRAAMRAVPGLQRGHAWMMEKRFERFAGSITGGIYHETNYVMKPFSGSSVVTVHDLSHIHYPHFHPHHVIRWLNRGLPPSLERADLVITVSNVIRREIVEIFGLSEDRVRTVYLGVDESYKPRGPEETEAVLERYGLMHGAYVLLAATLEPRKGIDVMLQAWSLLPLSMRREFPLVMVGAPGWRNETIIERIHALVAEGTVRHYGFVPSADLRALLSGAAVFCYPSVYEGFGLPVLEAMSSGVPAICRAGTSMAEVARGDCLLCDTGEADELAGYIARLLEDEELRRLWGGRGLARSAAYSWPRCAEETLQVYRDLAPA